MKIWIEYISIWVPLINTIIHQYSFYTIYLPIKIILVIFSSRMIK